MNDGTAVDTAVARAAAAFPTWSGTPWKERRRLLKAFRLALANDAEGFAALAQREVGKPLQDGVNEVLHACNWLAWLGRNAERALRAERRGAWPLAHASVRVERRPLGVVAAIAPWNYPVALACGPVAAALAAGCTVALKPSEHAPETAGRLQRLWRTVGGPWGTFELVLGGPDAGRALAGHPGVAKVFFTGGAAGGRAVLDAAAANLTPAVLELGGCDAAIVLADADLERTARGLAWGAFLNSGQTCLAIRRCYAEASIAGRLADLVAAAAAGLRHHRDDGPFELPPLRTPGQAERLRELIAEACGRGAVALAPTAPPGRFPPTVLKYTPAEARVLREESFGPLLAVCPVADADEALRLANASPFGLGASVWTRDRRKAEALAGQLRVGGVAINDGLLQFAATSAPFGGWGRSGFGRIQGVEGLREFTATTAVVRNRWPGWADFHWFPYGPNEALLRRVLRWLHRW